MVKLYIRYVLSEHLYRECTWQTKFEKQCSNHKIMCRMNLSTTDSKSVLEQSSKQSQNMYINNKPTGIFRRVLGNSIRKTKVIYYIKLIVLKLNRRSIKIVIK